MLAHLKGLLTESETQAIRRELSDAPFDDGRKTARGGARSTKHNLQLDPAHPSAQKWATLILEKFSASETFGQVAWPKKIQPFRFCRYDEGMAYGDHVDLPSMGQPGGPQMRTDLSVTLFLSPLDEYEGGQLTLAEDFGIKKVRAAPGDAVIYPSNMVHRVEPVTRGTRLVAISWIESRIRDARDRKFIFDMGSSISALEQRVSSDPAAAADLLQLRNCYYQLTRRWLD